MVLVLAFNFEKHLGFQVPSPHGCISLLEHNWAKQSCTEDSWPVDGTCGKNMTNRGSLSSVVKSVGSYVGAEEAGYCEDVQGFYTVF